MFRKKYTLHWLLVMLHFVCLDGKTPQSRRTTRDRMKRKRGEFGAVFAALLLRRTDAMRVSRDPREKSGKSGRNLKIRKSKRRLCRPLAPPRGCESLQNCQKSAIAAKVQKQFAEKSCRAIKIRVTDAQLDRIFSGSVNNAFSTWCWCRTA